MLPKSYSSVFAFVCVCMCVCLRLYCLGQSRNCRLRHHSVVTNKEPNLIPHAVINKLMQYYTGMRIFYRTLLSSSCVRESGSHFQIKNIQAYTSGKRRRSEESFAYMWILSDLINVYRFTLCTPTQLPLGWGLTVQYTHIIEYCFQNTSSMCKEGTPQWKSFVQTPGRHICTVETEQSDPGESENDSSPVNKTNELLWCIYYHRL